jgi:hypothetical protein
MDGDEADAREEQRTQTAASEVRPHQVRRKKPPRRAPRRLRKAWKWVIEGGPVQPLLGIGVLSAIIYASYRNHLRADFMEHPLPHFDVLRRSIWWLFAGAAVRAILGPLALLVGYGVIHRFLIRKRWFIVVSEFRAWGKLAEKYPEPGIAAALGDELMRLWAEMRVLGARKGSSDENSDQSPSGPDDYETGSIQLGHGGLSLPETNITLQYNGISLEAMHSFVRRFTGREVVITGDLIRHPSGLLLAARTSRDEPWQVLVKRYDSHEANDRKPWEVLINTADSDPLEIGLRRLAFLIMTTMVQRFQPKPERTFALLQIKARKLGDFDLAIQLAKLALKAARDAVRDEGKVKRNLATAYNDKGVALAKKEKYSEALPNFGEAFELDPEFEQAFNNLKQAAGIVQEGGTDDERVFASEAIRKATEVRMKNV